MDEVMATYRSAVTGLGVFGALYVVQLLVADVVGVLRKHTPGTGVPEDPGDLLFRAHRAHANTTESVGALILIAGFAIAAGGDPAWVNATVWAYVGVRVVHMAAYYADVRLLRSIAFALGVGCLLSLFLTGLRAL